MIIAPLCSGSTANSTFAGSKTSGILIDVGCSYKALQKYLAVCGLELSAVKAVLITHEHIDHVKGLFQFTKNTDIPVFASSGTRDMLIEKNFVYNPDRLFDLSDFESRAAGDVDLEVRTFNTSHDSAQSVGFTITCNDGKKAAYMTDLGEVTPGVEEATLGCNFAFVESNYDYDLLWSNKNYPYQLKERIDSPRGHLSNTDSADYILKLVESGTNKIMLGHLSKENNTPQIAFDKTVNRLDKAKIHVKRDYSLDVAGIQTIGKYVAI